MGAALPYRAPAHTPPRRGPWENARELNTGLEGDEADGQYYAWANLDRCEYIDDEPFEGTGFMLERFGWPGTTGTATALAPRGRTAWWSDLVDMSDDAPGQGYRDVTEETSASWLPGPTIMADDGVVERASEWYVPCHACRARPRRPPGGWQEHSQALEVLASLLGTDAAGPSALCKFLEQVQRPRVEVLLGTLPAEEFASSAVREAWAVSISSSVVPFRCVHLGKKSCGEPIGVLARPRPRESEVDGRRLSPQFARTFAAALWHRQTPWYHVMRGIL